MIINNTDEIYKNTFGLWISSLFSAISGENPNLSFSEHKEFFFIILSKWLDERKICFCRPDSPLEDVWNAPTSEVVDYLKNNWPKQVRDELDPDLTMYFYEIPAILWIGEDGTLNGS